MTYVAHQFQCVYSALWWIAKNCAQQRRESVEMRRLSMRQLTRKLHLPRSRIRMSTFAIRRTFGSMKNLANTSTTSVTLISNFTICATRSSGNSLGFGISKIFICSLYKSSSSILKSHTKQACASRFACHYYSTYG